MPANAFWAVAGVGQAFKSGPLKHYRQFTSLQPGNLWAYQTPEKETVRTAPPPCSLFKAGQLCVSVPKTLRQAVLISLPAPGTTPAQVLQP